MSFDFYQNPKLRLIILKSFLVKIFFRKKSSKKSFFGYRAKTKLQHGCEKYLISVQNNIYGELLDKLD